jgi:hypothetical protein
MRLNISGLSLYLCVVSAHSVLFGFLSGCDVDNGNECEIANDCGLSDLNALCRKLNCYYADNSHCNKDKDCVSGSIEGHCNEEVCYYSENDVEKVMGGIYKTHDEGYWTSGDASGFVWIYASGEETEINKKSFILNNADDDFCVEGWVGPNDKSESNALLVFNLNQSKENQQKFGVLVPDAVSYVSSSEGLNVNISSNENSVVRVQLMGPDWEYNSDEIWCAEIGKTGGQFIKWKDFNTRCWDMSGESYEYTPLVAIGFLVPGQYSKKTPFDFCVKKISPVFASDTREQLHTYSDCLSLTENDKVYHVERNRKQYGVVANVTETGNGNGSVEAEFCGTRLRIADHIGDNSDGLNIDDELEPEENFENGRPISFPSVFIGPYNQFHPMQDNLPIALSDIDSIMTTWKWDDTDVQGVYDVVYELWMSPPNDMENANERYRLIVTLNYPDNQLYPGYILCDDLELARLRGAICRVSEYLIEDKYGRMYYFTDENERDVTIDLNEILKVMLTENIEWDDHLSEDLILTNIFAGFWIWEGGIGLETTDFYIDVK